MYSAQTRPRAVGVLWLLPAASAVTLVLGLGAGETAMHAQAPTAAVFDVASVKANKSGETQVTVSWQGGVTMINVPLRAIVQFAYGINTPSRISGQMHRSVTGFVQDFQGEIERGSNLGRVARGGNPWHKGNLRALYARGATRAGGPLGRFRTFTHDTCNV